MSAGKYLGLEEARKSGMFEVLNGSAPSNVPRNPQGRGPLSGLCES